MAYQDEEDDYDDDQDQKPIITSPARIMRGMAQIGTASGAAVGIIGQAGGGKMVCEPFPQN